MILQTAVMVFVLGDWFGILDLRLMRNMISSSSRRWVYSENKKFEAYLLYASCEKPEDAVAILPSLLGKEN